MVKYYSCESAYFNGKRIWLGPGAQKNEKTKQWEANRGNIDPFNRYYCERINEFQRKKFDSAEEISKSKIYGSHFANNKYNDPPTIIECDNQVKESKKAVYTESTFDSNDKLISCKAETKD